MTHTLIAIFLLLFGLALPFLCVFLGIPVNTRNPWGFWWW